MLISIIESTGVERGERAQAKVEKRKVKTESGDERRWGERKWMWRWKVSALFSLFNFFSAPDGSWVLGTRA